MTLYEINNAITEVLEGAIDPETGEILNEDLVAAYEQLQLDRSTKVENIACFIKNLKAESEAIKGEVKNLQARQKANENKAEHLKEYLAFCLQGEKFSSPKASVSFRRSEAVNVLDIDQLPEDFLRFKEPEADKTKIKDALKAGQTIPGAR